MIALNCPNQPHLGPPPTLTWEHYLSSGQPYSSAWMLGGCALIGKAATLMCAVVTLTF